MKLKEVIGLITEVFNMLYDNLHTFVILHWPFNLNITELQKRIGHLLCLVMHVVISFPHNHDITNITM